MNEDPAPGSSGAAHASGARHASDSRPAPGHRANGSRATVLARVRAALGDVPEGESPDDVPALPGPRRPTAPDDAVALFAERVADYRATVVRCAPDEVAGAVAALLARRGARRVVVPDGFPPAYLTGVDADLVRDAPPLTVRELDLVDSALTTAALAVAETGTLVLDAGPGQGRRALTLIPDHHLCVVRAEQVVPDVPEALAGLDPRRPLTFVSGPSATSDIELDRVEGVHGPRTLDVVLVAPEGPVPKPSDPPAPDTPGVPR
ncbi:lactate utilization protein C [Streptomyces sp. NPDC092359]|uniref:LutC/YkgG family protein n=1 Tax=Streptomyces sp. NPDC092359 TaxID=3366014 RepID=UPI00381A80A4